MRLIVVTVEPGPDGTPTAYGVYRSWKASFRVADALN